MNRPALLLTLLAATTVAACSDDAPGKTPVMTDPDAGAPPVTPESGVAVVLSDYKSTSISLLDPVTAIVTRDNCINSGTAAPGLSLALSGDVALPSAPQPGHELVLIDRQNAALTWIDAATCKVKHQLAVGTGFSSNPHDLLTLSPTKAYVTRFDRNPKAADTPDGRDDGDDILIIDPTAATVTGRIDLAPFADTASEKTLQARPDRAVLIGDKVYVALAHLSADFMAAGHGRILVVDPATDSVSGMIDLPGLKGCLGLSYLDASKTLVVTCGGDFNDLSQVSGSGVVAINLDATPPAIVATFPATTLGTQPVSSDAGGALTSTTGLAISNGAFKGPPFDRLWSYDFAGAPVMVLEAKESFVYGDLLGDPQRQQVFFADATSDKPRVHIVDVTGAPTVRRSIDASPTTGLPPRALGWY